ncbi:MAG: hypothetical protein OEZ58_22820, partial [Gammaproteobacteria bacterium]|nr:hypothetical protein [Gammaproteobacteria bacterium]
LSKPTQKLPTGRITAENQFKLLRGIAIASGHELTPVSNKEIADVVQMHQNTVSIGNPFYADIGLIEKVGQKIRATQELANYAERCKWSEDDAGHKLRNTIENTWFAKAILPRLSLHTINIDEAISVLGEASNASPEYKPQLQILLRFLEFSGLITIENNTVILQEVGINEDAPPKKEVPPPPPKNQFELDNNFEVFQIPIPGKPSAVFKIPKNLSSADWVMLKTMLEAYISHLSKQGE